MSTAAAVAVVVRARKERECRNFMEEFDSYTATVSEQKYYADCVDFINADPATGTEVLLLTIVLVCALVGMVVGAIRG